MAVLKLDHVSASYGSIAALHEISLEVNEGEIVTLIGSNGAGKSTTMKSIMGLKGLKNGTIFFGDQDITGWKTKKRVAGGMVLVPEGRQIFPKFTVQGNLEIGGYLKPDETVQENVEMVYGLFPRLRERKDQLAGTLSGGEQQMLAVGRAMVSMPKLLLLDEPSLGLAPLMVQDLFQLIQRIRDMGTTILLVEQNAKSALKISDRGYVLETGRIVLSGAASQLLGSEDVRRAYLGI